MILLDSDVVILGAKPEYVERLAPLIVAPTAISAISYLEVLGFHRLNESDRIYFERFFDSCTILPIDQPVLDRAVALRQQRKMSLGDALIAATALFHGLTLATRNISDFKWIDGLATLDPLAERPDGIR